MPEEKGKTLTPELLAKISKQQGTASATWFGVILAGLGIPRQFFPLRWSLRITKP
jgi:hypothetical protein